MESKTIGYSLKNIPIPSKSSYLKSMMDKVENFIKRIRWKAHFFFDKPMIRDNEVSETDYHRLLSNNITSNYIKWENGVKVKTNQETKKIAESLVLRK